MPYRSENPTSRASGYLSVSGQGADVALRQIDLNPEPQGQDPGAAK